MIKDNDKTDILEDANRLRYEMGPNFHEHVVESIYADAAEITGRSVLQQNQPGKFNFDRVIDKIVTGKITGIPIMFLMLAIVFWLTVAGANVPSAMIASVLVDTLHPVLREFGQGVGLPWWLNGVIFDGAYLAAAWVVSVMLPPMAIFFPLFTLLEDFGYLPRVAFNLDGLFRKAGAHGKQALTMSMGFGCNAAGIISARIIDSPRERLIAIITNNFSLCNGRWPTQILISTIFIGSLVPAHLAGIVSAAAVVGITLLGISFMFIVSFVLSKTILKGEASAFSLELPPYRPPQILQTLYTSLIDRTLFVLWRAVVFAVPAGIVIYSSANFHIGDLSIAEHFIHWANPFGLLLGLNGIILLAYIIAIPANEIVVPTILMLTTLMVKSLGLGSGAGIMFELDSVADTAMILHAGGWTTLTGINLMLFSLLHNPCSTTIYTIYKETGSVKWTVIATFLPILMGFLICYLVASLWGIL